MYLVAIGGSHKEGVPMHETNDPGNEVVKKKADLLRSELEGLISYAKVRGIVNYWIALVLMLITVTSSFAAGIGGLFLNWGQKVLGGLAVVPGVIALVATTMKFQGKQVGTTKS